MSTATSPQADESQRTVVRRDRAISGREEIENRVSPDAESLGHLGLDETERRGSRRAWRSRR